MARVRPWPPLFVAQMVKPRERNERYVDAVMTVPKVRRARALRTLLLRTTIHGMHEHAPIHQHLRHTHQCGVWVGLCPSWMA